MSDSTRGAITAQARFRRAVALSGWGLSAAHLTASAPTSCTPRRTGVATSQPDSTTSGPMLIPASSARCPRRVASPPPHVTTAVAGPASAVHRSTRVARTERSTHSPILLIASSSSPSRCASVTMLVASSAGPDAATCLSPLTEVGAAGLRSMAVRSRGGMAERMRDSARSSRAAARESPARCNAQLQSRRTLASRSGVLAARARSASVPNASPASARSPAARRTRKCAHEAISRSSGPASAVAISRARARLPARK